MAKLSDKERYERAWLKNGFLRPRYNYDCFEKGIIPSYKSWYIFMRIQTRKQVELLHTQLVRKQRASRPLSFYCDVRKKTSFVYGAYDIKTPSTRPYNKGSFWDLGLNQYFAGQDPYKPYQGDPKDGIYHDEVKIFLKGSIGIAGSEYEHPFKRWLPLSLSETREYVIKHYSMLSTVLDTSYIYCFSDDFRTMLAVNLYGNILRGFKHFKMRAGIFNTFNNTATVYPASAARIIFKKFWWSEAGVGKDRFVALRPLLMSGTRILYKEHGWSGSIVGGTFRISFDDGGAARPPPPVTIIVALVDMIGSGDILAQIREEAQKEFPDRSVGTVRKTANADFAVIPLYHTKAPFNPIERSDRWLRYWDKCYRLHIYEEKYWYQSFARFIMPVVGISLIVGGVIFKKPKMIKVGAAMLGNFYLDLLSSTIFDNTFFGDLLEITNSFIKALTIYDQLADAPVSEVLVDITKATSTGMIDGATALAMVGDLFASSITDVSANLFLEVLKQAGFKAIMKSFGSKDDLQIATDTDAKLLEDKEAKDAKDAKASKPKLLEDTSIETAKLV